MKKGMVTDEIKALIGKPYSYPPLKEILKSFIVEIPGWNEDVEKGAIKKWATANEDFNPLWLDEEFAKKTRWGGIIAPPTFLISIDPGYGPALEIFHKAPEDWAGFLYAAAEWEFFEPVRPGDHITYETWLEDAYEKQGKAGPLLFLLTRTVFTNQRGERVASHLQTTIVPGTGGGQRQQKTLFKVVRRRKGVEGQSDG